MGYNYQDSKRESQQEYFGEKKKRADLENQVRFMGMQIDNLKAICRTDNKETLQNALKRIEELEGQVTRAFEVLADKRKRIKELEQENAELKKENKTLRIHQTNAVLEGLEMEVLKNSHRDRANNLQDQLTKAKELLKLMLKEFERLDVLCNYQLRTEAEQFLKDSEVEK